MKKILISALVVLLTLIIGQSFSTTAQAGRRERCGDEETYIEYSDHDDQRVHIEFEEDEHWKSNYKRTISVTAGPGYAITRVYLDVENDNQNGFHEYATGSIINFNPSPGDKIERVKVIVVKVCPTPSPTPSATPTPTPSPTPTPTTSPTPTITPDPTTTPNPDPTSTPGPGKETKVGYTQIFCPNPDFEAVADLLENGQPKENIVVKFIYNDEAKFATTNKDGQARVRYGFRTESPIYFEPEQGYPHQANTVINPNCAPVASSQGQILGASTLAETGVLEDILMKVAALAGAFSTTVGTLLYGKKKRA